MILLGPALPTCNKFYKSGYSGNSLFLWFWKQFKKGSVRLLPTAETEVQKLFCVWMYRMETVIIYGKAYGLVLLLLWLGGQSDVEPISGNISNA